MKKLKDINPFRDRLTLTEPRLLSSKGINKTLFVIFIILLVGFILDILFVTKKEPLLFYNLEKIEEKVSRPSEKNIRELPSLSYYFDQINKRTLFKSNILTKPVTKLSDSIEEITSSDFVLMGIVSGAKPQAIIQNKKTNKTYFLYTGQSQDNLKVEKINSGSVKLNYKGESFELFL